MMKLRRIFAIAMILCMTLSVSAHAAGFPSQSIRLIIPITAGGATDLVARILAEELSSAWGGVEVIVENKPGEGGAITMRELIQAPADGYTLALAATGTVAMTPILSDVGYTKDDIVPIVQIAELPTNLFVRADGEIQSMEDLMRLAEANFGSLTFSAGTGGIHHIVAELFMLAAGKPGLLTHMPAGSGLEGLTAVVEGRSNMAFASASYGEPFVNQQGVLKLIATSSGQGCPIVAGVPTFRSLGYDVAIANWTGLFARTGTPEGIINTVAEAVGKAMENPEVIEAMAGFGMPAVFMNRADFTAKYFSQYEQLAEVLADLF
jgi:tripartite-type tricarboxylate transporter receptor subunit TctC